MIHTYDNMGYSMDEVELYDIANDPYQTKNIRDEHSDIVCDHEYLLKHWMDEQKAKPHAIPDPMEAVLNERQKGG